MSRNLKTFVWLALLLLAAALKFWEQNQLPKTATSKTPPSSQSTAWETIPSASLSEDRNNDGDSFKLRHDGQVQEFRLYFVDAPEKRRHQYNGDRLRHQGDYFGGLSESQTIEIGQQAKALTENLLRQQPFELITRWQRVFGSERRFAFIRFADGDYLSEKLTRAGLSRIYTEGAPLPDGRSEFDFEQHLKQLEAEAKRLHRGGWGAR